jgi:hypothetical protein
MKKQRDLNNIAAKEHRLVNGYWDLVYWTGVGLPEKNNLLRFFDKRPKKYFKDDDLNDLYEMLKVWKEQYYDRKDRLQNKTENL